ncbi:hypothetical protein PV405_34380 [Streptomyces sp. ME02-6979-3A]|uniref:hypothetical protein n=1 Tax=Streptomyces sp. ME02-6979-3A TaxID=3028673 RepID=UPI0029A91A2C|nr:hypothetical protein [Streptomyces sp. ME02-6979-3A]MDX3329684.1 hypothetical protein [Streptomyces sp. ME02-6979-3A]
MTTVKLHLRKGGPLEEVDLDILTPKARALAEAIHANPGHQPIGVVCATGQTKGDNPNFRLIHGDGPEADALAAEPHVVTIRNFGLIPADSPTTAADWLEREASALPLDAYPIAGVKSRVGPATNRVPSADAAATDRYLTRDGVLTWMRDAGQPMSVQAWATLRGTGFLPEPDRYVLSKPQWKPETIDTLLGRDRELWPVSQVAAFLGFEGPSASGSARKQLSRWGFTAEGRAPGRGGESLFAADQVQAAHAHRPGRGRHGAARTGGKFAGASDQPDF